MNTIDAISTLKRYPPSGDSAVYVSGYYRCGDGGGGHYVWHAKSQAEDNSGTVIASGITSQGRWHLQHRGIGDFRMFGILDDNKPADDALDALVNDPGIVTVNAFSNLWFQRRHRFSRSGITLDFQSFHLSTQDIEPAGSNAPFAAVLFFQGVPEGDSWDEVLTELLPEQTDVFPVTDSHRFHVGEWYTVQVDATAGSAARELQKLVQVTNIVDATHIQVGYFTGWALLPGRQITWQHIVPVQDIAVKNMRFTGAGADPVTGSHPLAFEYAVWANVEGIHATGSFWPAIMRRWNTHYRTQQCSLVNPPDTATGGAGYLTQQIYCLYGHVSDCRVSNARHLNDFTASAYCRVENCHADGQSAEKGPFVTHGQYEHDLTYACNSGLMTFANSGATWGNAARRIHVSKHVCPWFVARAGVSELTLEDVTVLANPCIAGSGMLWVNADGLQMSGCTSNGVLRITQSSSRSARPNLITGCGFTLPDDGSALTDNSVTTPVNFYDTVFWGINGHTLEGNRLNFTRCEFWGGENQQPARFSSQHLSLQTSRLQAGHIEVSAPGDVALVNLLLDSCILDFIAFSVTGNATLIFCQNRLRHTVLEAFPSKGKNVISESNIVMDE
ncbi:hypothetical protein [Photorhabdus luminescens]|uniref:Peptidase C14 n=1 Tax=Photorhabdus luminescens subsp. sonorensis TaxID=1173677 RepID=A0A5C4REX2_PHOLU|nr:hypothetical protein [Photorhabdus luminescens]TNH42339.1 hypothetical protein EP164_17560 [Photorhabdus luminescens subsp. sonorensis]